MAEDLKKTIVNEDFKKSMEDVIKSGFAKRSKSNDKSPPLSPNAQFFDLKTQDGSKDLSIVYDPMRDTLTINGLTWAAEMFRREAKHAKRHGWKTGT